MNVDKTAHLPTAVYRIYDANDRLIYIGQSQRMGQRMRQHSMHSWWYSLVDRIELDYYPNRAAGITAEALAIQEMQPAFNVMGTTSGPVLTPEDARMAWEWRCSGRGRFLGMTVHDLVCELARGIPRRGSRAAA